MTTQNLQALSPAKRALYELRANRARTMVSEQPDLEPIAIVGVGLRFPGGASDASSYWNVLRLGVDAIRPIPSDRWDRDRYYDPDPDAPGKMYTQEGAFLDDIDGFDSSFFGISPREARTMDPQQRLLLEVTWQALEDAGQNAQKLAGTPVGVFFALSNCDYAKRVFADPEGVGPYASTGTNYSVAAGRVSFILGLTGPSMVVDTACSGSLVSVHLARRSLLAGDCQIALAGGVNLILSPEIHINFCKAGMLAPDGRCKTFDAAADGYGRGEGCGVIVLKRLADALAGGDRILALLPGSAVNQDGRSSGLTVPNGPAQQAVIRHALHGARIEPGDIDYVEAHGTGTKLGDPIEAHALAGELGPGRTRPLVLGSVKTNFGHLEAAAGVAGLVKVVLALEHEFIPPHLHFRTMNPHINWAGTPVEVPVAGKPWPQTDRPRRAGVSSFGFSGTNAHVIVEEAPAPLRAADNPRDVHLLVLSAQTPPALDDLTARHAGHCSTASVGDRCFTAAVGRAHFAERAVYLARTSDELRQRLDQRQAVARGHVARLPNVAFLFAGSGEHVRQMGRQLYDAEPVFRAVIDDCGFSGLLFSREAGPLGDEEHTQRAVFAIECALAALWQSWGVHPAVVLGQGVGEYAAACTAGVITRADALRLLADASRLTPERAGLALGDPCIASACRPPGIPVISAALGREVTADDFKRPDHWHRSLRGGSLERALGAAADCEVVVEIGSGTTLQERSRDVTDGDHRFWALSIHPDRPESEQLAESLSELYARGVPIDWDAYYKGRGYRRICAPTYPFQRQRHWLDGVARGPSSDEAWRAVGEACGYQSSLGRLDLDVLSYARRWHELEALSTAYITAAICDLGVFRTPGESHTPESLLAACGIQHGHARLLGRWLDRLVAHGAVEAINGSYVARRSLDRPDVDVLRERAGTAFGSDRIFLDYVVACGSQLVAVLKGAISPLETLFPGGDLARARALYEHSPLSAYYASIARAALEALGRGRPEGLRVLEIGGGTGATTSALLPVLAGRRAEYVFTDISEFFLKHAAQRFSSCPFMRTRMLDVEKPAGPLGEFDVVVATNVLHACRDLDRALGNVRSLLRSGGHLILCEATTYLPWFDVTTGLIEGWQQFDDNWRGDHPLLEADVWLRALAAAGFTRSLAVPDKHSPAAVLGQHVVVAQNQDSRSLVGHDAPAGLKDWGQAADDDSPALDLSSIAPAERRERVRELVCRELAAVLGVADPDSLDLRRPLIDLGIDSLMAVQIRARLGHVLCLERALPATLIFDHPTIDALARFLETEVLGFHEFRAGANPQASALARRIGGMSESEAEALLLERLESFRPTS